MLKKRITRLWSVAAFMAIIVFSGLTFAAEVIIDNGDAGTTPTGTWLTSSGPNPYGGFSLYANSSATYTYEASVSGPQEVSLWWTYWSNRCTSVQVDIYGGTNIFDAVLLDTVTVNQKIEADGGQWNVLGTYNFTGFALVVINSGGGCTTCADAVKFDLCLDPDLVVESINYTPANPDPGQQVTVDVTVKNQGCVDAGPFIIDWYSDKPVLPAPFEGGDKVAFVNSLAAGATYTMIAQYTYASADCYSTYVQVDTDQNVTESDENNNILGPQEICVGSTCLPLPSDGIMDNGSQWATPNGTWINSSGANYYGTRSVYSSQADDSYTYCASGVNGAKEVSLRWTWWGNRCTSVPVVIFTDGNTFLAEVLVNQLDQAKAGQWISLGTYFFSGTAKVVIRSQGGCTTSADAVRITNAPVAPAPAPVPKTGETADTYGTGSDGDLEKGVAWPNPRFTDNGNGTVRDNLTGLIWTRNATLFLPQKVWVTALTDCNGLSDATSALINDGSIAGDWRLPQILELNSLIHYGVGAAEIGIPNTQGDNAWTEGNPFTGVENEFYFSSTVDERISGNVLGVHLARRLIESRGQSVGYVWCVRGP